MSKNITTEERNKKKENIILRTFTGHSKKTWIWIAIFLGIVLISIVLLYEQFRNPEWLFSIVVNYFAIPVLKMGPWGWVLYIGFMGFQGVILPIPSELVLLSSGLIWGLGWGVFLGLIGSMFAGILTYYIALLGGRPLAEKFVGADNIALVDKLITKYGAGLIVIARATPFIAFDPISYASGLLKIKLRTYILATFFGSIIRCLFYAWLGSSLIGQGKDLNYFIQNPQELSKFISEGSGTFNRTFLIIIIVIVALFIFYQYILMPYLKKKQNITISETTTETKKADKKTEEVEKSKKETNAIIDQDSGPPSKNLT